MAKQTEKDDEPEFTNLRSDVELREKVKILTFENPSDERGVTEILKQPYLSLSNRTWFKSLIARKGTKFVEVKAKKKA